MAITLSAATERTAVFLRDSAGLRFSQQDLTGSLRLALAEISLSAGEAMQLEGLDGALTTSLPPHLEHLLVVGGAGYAALGRAAARADWELQDAGEFDQLRQWAEASLRDFRSQLRQAYPVETARLYGQRRSVSPWAAWPDDFGERQKESLE